MKNIILFGPPGSGKGTQAKMLMEKHSLLHISTGDLFRSEIKNETDLGVKAQSYIKVGDLVPDEITIGMLKKKVENHPDVCGFIFDGFPRTVEQAEALDEFLQQNEQEISQLIALEVTNEEIINRILERGKTSGRRDDQDETVIVKRIHVYKRETKIVYDYYDKKDKAMTVDGMGTIEEIHERLSDIVEEL